MKTAKHIQLAAIGMMVLGPVALMGLTQESVNEYWSVAMGRAEKIVQNLNLEDASVAEPLAEVVATQYKDLFVLDELRNEAQDALESFDHGIRGFEEDSREALKEATRQAVRNLHREYIARLTALVDAETVNKVKDGMTYNVAPNTYGVYMDMFPDLPAEHCRQIKAWLLEAREYAMDAGSSNEKHRWFGKYKGRINNYLSDLGYDLKAAERAMFERMKK